MKGELKVYVGVAPNMLRNSYTARHQLLFGGFSLQVGDASPAGDMMSGEFLLVLLLHWNKAIHRLADRKSRSAKLFFTVMEGEIWVRKTAKPWWKVSSIDYLQKPNRIRAEVLCVPGRLEAGLLSVSRKVLAGAQKAGIRTPDCGNGTVPPRPSGVHAAGRGYYCGRKPGKVRPTKSIRHSLACSQVHTGRPQSAGPRPTLPVAADPNALATRDPFHGPHHQGQQLELRRWSRLWCL